MTSLAPPPPPPPPPSPPAAALPARRRRGWIALTVLLIAGLLAAAVVVVTRLGAPHAHVGGSGSPPTTEDQAQQLEDAFMSGRINRSTWLLYRAYSMFGASSLPRQFSGGAQNSDDISLGEELISGDPLEGDVRDAITALISRPTDPHSVYYGDGPLAAAADVPAGSALLGADEAAYGDRCKLDPSAWIAAYTKKFPGVTLPGEAAHGAFKVWTRCTGDWQSRLTTAVTLIDGLWGPETALMGQPIPDADPADPTIASHGGDSAIDFYLVPRDFETDRLGSSGVTLTGIARATTRATGPFMGRKCSGFVLLDQGRINDPLFREDVAHELFHVLEYAHNHTVLREKVNGTMQVNWYTEAAAAWAGFHFARDVATYNFVKVFQASASLISLDASAPHGSILALHAYGAFMWFYFLEQEQGAQAIARVWTALESANSASQATAAIDGILSFDSHFQDFAVRNLDEKKYKSGVGTSYQDLDPNFPEVPASDVGGIFPSTQQGVPDGSRTVSLDHLTASYYYVTPNLDVKQVTFTFALQPSSHAHADLLAHSASGYKRITLSTTGDTTVCVEGVDDMRLVVSNSDFKGSSISGTIATKGRADCAAPLAITSVAPNHVSDGTSTTVVIKGSGFTSFKNPNVALSTPSGGFADISNMTVRVVSDSEIDVSGTFSAPGGYAFFDVTVFESPGPVDSTTHVTCSECLSIDAGP